jgi:hypothetical protein
MTIPQWIMIVLLVIETISHNWRTNKTRPDEPLSNIITTIIRMGILTYVLYWGGFWT